MTNELFDIIMELSTVNLHGVMNRDYKPEQVLQRLKDANLKLEVFIEDYKRKHFKDA